MNFNYNDFAKDKWELDVAESIANIDCYVHTLATILVAKGVFTTEELNKAVEENKANDYYANIFKGISELRELIRQYESGEKDPIQDWFKDLLNRGDAT